jgi:uncharacterized phage protein (TIGR01671 family)
MREIKFRAWDLKRKRWLADNEFRITSGGNLQIPDEHGGFGYESVFETGVVLMQFTGLKDKNGTEIYEGDIFHFTDSEVNTPWTVFWSRDGWKMAKHGREEWDFFRLGDPSMDKIEVVGDICENPELLK